MPKPPKHAKWLVFLPFIVVWFVLAVVVRRLDWVPELLRVFVFIPPIVIGALMVVVLVFAVLKGVEGVTGKAILDEGDDAAQVKERQEKWHRGLRNALDWLRSLIPEEKAQTDEGAPAAAELKPPAAQAPAPSPAAVAAVRTPQEERFSRLAISHKALNRDQVQRCLEFQAQKREQGSIIPLWDCSVLLNLLAQPVAEQLREEAGELDADTVGQFTIVRKLGKGGMGSVYLAMDADGQSVAVKVLSPQLARERPSLTRFLREAQAAIKLRHRNLVRGIALGEDAGRYFYAMEFVAGKNVRDMIAESAPLPSDLAARIILQTAEGLAHAHERGIIHRDIKPSNIMVAKDGVAKLADLGLVRHTEGDLTVLTRSGIGMGTPSYMAPEQITDAKRADARSDVYSLGATWYHMVTGQPPFAGATTLEVCQKHLNEPLVPPRALRPDLPEAVSRTIEQMMAKAPEERIQTAPELCRIIREAGLA